MWGVGWGRWNFQHYFLPHPDMKTDDGTWTALCGVWMRDKPQASKLPQCRDCKRALEKRK